MKFNKIPETTFQQLQLNAGILLSSFNPSTAIVDNNAIIGATTGGVEFSATPEYSDFGEDIDNAPKNMKELKQLDNWTVEISGTFVTVDGNSIKTALGAADIDKSDCLNENELLVVGNAGSSLFTSSPFMHTGFL